MRSILLGTPPDQITEAEKLRRLQDIADRRVALTRGDTVEEIVVYFERLNALILEEQELDRLYPDVP